MRSILSSCEQDVHALFTNSYPRTEREDTSGQIWDKAYPDPNTARFVVSVL
ncbi:hypothetical protein DPMN_054989 [Dreissena polymorpha]|uniref:Uncharacterized protein n=1 Tax=Dreissena polymorpha TaxID=45954 RepID=A0A9D4HS37_DREPO|nr:hypothetical protein DPMN_054989 [Dreissena polymorpha]